MAAPVSYPTLTTHIGTNTITGNTLIGGGGGGYTYDFTPATQVVACAHEMDDETELDDGRVSGHCSKCGDKIIGRRLAGGMGLATLKAALVDAMGDRDAMADLATEMQRVERMIELEVESVESARRMLLLARRMLTEILE